MRSHFYPLNFKTDSYGMFWKKKKSVDFGVGKPDLLEKSGLSE